MGIKAQFNASTLKASYVVANDTAQTVSTCPDCCDFIATRTVQMRVDGGAWKTLNREGSSCIWSFTIADPYEKFLVDFCQFNDRVALYYWLGALSWSCTAVMSDSCPTSDDCWGGSKFLEYQVV